VLAALGLLVLASAGVAAAPAPDSLAHPAAVSQSATVDSTRTPAIHFDREGRSTGIPIRIKNNHIILNASVNGRDSVSLVLDSGASVSVLGAAFADSLGLEVGEHHEAHGAGGAATAGITRGVTVALQGLVFDPGTFDTLPTEGIAAADGQPVDGILGRPLFERSVVKLDYLNGTMDVYDAEGWVYRGHGKVLPLTFESRLPYVKATVKLPGRKPVKARFVLDTGSAASLLFTADWAAEHRAVESVGTTLQVVARGVGGEIKNLLGRVEWFQLGGVRLDRPLSQFRTPGPGNISQPGTAGNIGGQVLRRFTVYFDYPHKHLILEPNELATNAFDYDAAGMQLRAPPPGFQTIVVGTVIAATPASEQGLRTGDVIESVDGRAAGEIGLDPLRAMFRRDGITYQLVVRRGDERLQLTLTTRRLV
jgi:hypothetical protein